MSIRASRACEAGRREEEECLLELNLSKNILLADFNIILVSSAPLTTQPAPVPGQPCQGGGGGGVNGTKVKYNCLILQNDTSESYLSRETDTIEQAGSPALYWVWSSGQMADLGVIKITQS